MGDNRAMLQRWFKRGEPRDVLSTALAAVSDRRQGRSLLDARVLRSGTLDREPRRVELSFGYYDPPGQALIAAELAAELARAGVADVAIASTVEIRAHEVQGGLPPLGSIRNIIAVGSGKGGVGKSTVAANLALALAHDGARVGVLDADIYGPSQSIMFGVSGQPEIIDGERFAPKRAHGLALMSVGFMVDEATPLIMRGPMVSKTLQQLAFQTAWGALDYLVVDLPPGTGDVQLTLCQRIPVAGAMVVTTPQDLALLDARKAVGMFNKIGVGVLGVVENMSTHVCSQCGHEEAIFGVGGGARLAAEADVVVLGQLPLELAVRADIDAAVPTVVGRPESATAERYLDIARNAAARLAMRPRIKAIALNTVIQNG